MSQEVKENDYQNDWAFNENFEHIHISQAVSGRNNYFCLGCKKEMVAAKGEVKAHYFRHYAKDVDKQKTECVVASRNYRERIAKDVLHRLKQLHLPQVYKSPPLETKGSPYLLSKPQTLIAHSVKSELSFYEDENCQIKYGKNPNIEERYLLIRPDITFFNSQQEPILLVEFVVTHKIDNEKRNKLKRLGINTVQIIIPKKPEAEIEKALKSKSKIKWVYNEIEANTKYVFVPETSNNGIWSIDDEQRRIFEEDYKCRANQIKYLIRTVKRALESQSYKRAEQHFDQEISRVESVTKTERQGLVDMEARIDSEVRDELAGSFQAIESEEEKFVSEENSFQGKSKGLESRYLDKRSSLEKEHSELSRGYEQQVVFGDTEDGIRSDFESRRRKIKEEQAVVVSEKAIIERDIQQSPVGLAELTERERSSHTFKIEELESKRRAIESKIDYFGEYTIEEEGKLQVEHEKLREQIVERVNNRNIEGNTELSKRIESVLKAGRISSNYDERLKTYERYKLYLELARGGTWKK